MKKTADLVKKSRTQFRIRRMKADDIPGLVRIDAQSNAPGWSAESFERELLIPHSICLVSLAETVLAGFAAGWMIEDTLQILQLAVAPRFRRMGAGNMLVRAMLDNAQDQNISRAELELRSQNLPALKLYQQAGFYKTGMRKNFYADDHAVLMEIKLR